MTLAYYNEIDPYAARWLQNLILEGVIAPGHVDTRSIEDVTPNDLAGYTQCHFFAGIGVWSHALRLAGWPDDRAVWTGSCPCQPFSTAGKGRGFDDQRHLWPAWHYLIRELAPGTVFGEQVASPDGLAWFDLVQTDMEGEGYALGPKDLCAAGVGAPHIRQRLYFVAESSLERREGLHTLLQPGRSHQDRAEAAGRSEARELGDTSSSRGGRNTGEIPRTESRLERGVRRVTDELVTTSRELDLSASGGRERLGDQPAHGELVQAGAANGFWRDAEWINCRDGKARPVEPGTFPLAHGAPARVGRLRAYGNAIVAPLAAEFIRAYMGCVT